MEHAIPEYVQRLTETVRASTPRMLTTRNPDRHRRTDKARYGEYCAFKRLARPPSRPRNLNWRRRALRTDGDPYQALD